MRLRRNVAVDIAGIADLVVELSPLSHALGGAGVGLNVVRQSRRGTSEDEGGCEGNLRLGQHCRVSVVRLKPD